MIHHRPPSRLFPHALGALLAVAPTLVLAREPASSKSDVAACIGASEQVQELRRQGKLRDARDAVARCMDTKCPAMIRTDCDEFSRTIEASLPSIVVRITDAAGTDVAGAKLTLDGVEIPLDGRAIYVDPGTHEAHVSADGFQPSTLSFMAQEGVKNRTVDLKLSPKASAVGALAPPRTPRGSARTTGTWVATGALGVTAVAALSVFAGMGLSANSRYDELEARCGGRCASSDVDKLRTRYLVADVSLVVGVVSAVAATAVFLFGPRTHAEPAAHSAQR